MSVSKGRKSAIVIGAGFGGLATALRLNAKGYKVTILEKNAYAGGKVHEIRRSGFRFDRGPSLFTLPSWMDELFLLYGKNPGDYYQTERLDIICQYFYPDGTRILAHSRPEAFAAEIEAHTTDKAANVLGFLEHSAEIYDITSAIFLERSLHKSATYRRWGTLRSLLRFRKIDAFQTLAESSERWFRDEKTRQLFNRFATYNGSNPYKAPGTLGIIPHLEHNLGAYYPKGGMHRLTEALVRLCTETGIDIQYNTYVNRIETRKKQVIGVSTTSGSWPAELVVCNSDIRHAYGKLLHKVKAPGKTLEQPRSTSALIFFWGLKKAIPGLELHNLLFSADYREEFRQLEQGLTPSDPSVYLYASSVLHPADAPGGGMNLFAMINVPAASDGQEADWSHAREIILDKIRAQTGTDIRPDIVLEDILSPNGIEQETSSSGGALYGNSSNNRFSAFLRHPNFKGDVKGLYFVGGSVHPGGGIPLVLASAKIVANLVK